jgi:hypothetical protein
MNSIPFLAAVLAVSVLGLFPTTSAAPVTPEPHKARVIHWRATATATRIPSSRYVLPGKEKCLVKTTIVSQVVQGQSKVFAWLGEMIEKRISVPQDRAHWAKVSPAFYAKAKVGTKVDYGFHSVDGRYPTMVAPSNETDARGIATTSFTVEYPCNIGDVEIGAAGMANSVRIPVVRADLGDLFISDIDDTIRETNVLKPIQAVWNTLFHPFKPIQDMQSWYKKIETQTSKSQEKPIWHYVSGAPDALHESLSQFTSLSGYPNGQFHLRPLSGFKLINLLRKNDNYKLETIQSIQKEYPGRKMILIGDSTERDPEIFSEIYRLYPQKIKCIYIRKVTGVHAKKELKKNDLARFETLFKNIPAAKWKAFESTKELDGMNLLSSKCY